ncbi:ribosome biogenesis protein Nop16 [Dactylonectria macrodidyma]|uniref:Nucleolar protein 16 n=1 Tax=Dactylonectria macrodidyma TaxID=307937 RepID=A0A9P9FNM4_9HYPO|nr:ribosome biogenesis protein Nop16 [Dactylonectria macrodidyma]
MGRELQKKKRRSGRQPVRGSNKTKKILNPRGNSTIAKNWNKDETLSQNYRRLGLLARLKAPTGGTEKQLGAVTMRTSANDPFAITSVENAVVSEARVERDADGKIVRILGHSKPNPLNDPLNDLDEDSDMEDSKAEEWGGIQDDPEDTDVIKALLEQSRAPVVKTPRHQSTREREWLDAMVAKHGDDTVAMAKDRKLNPMQQTAADIAKRIRKLTKA